MLQRLLLSMFLIAGCAAQAEDLVYFGTRSTEPGRGIFAARFDAQSGQLTSMGQVASLELPTWVMAHPQLPVLYAVSEVGNDGLSEASVSSLEIDKATGQLRLMNSVGSVGGGATHLAVDPASRTVFAANFGSGQVTWFPTLPDGRLGMPWAVQSHYGSGPTLPRQSVPHAYGIDVDPSRRYALVTDMGADRIFIYRFDAATRQFVPAPTPFVRATPGSGPRRVKFSPDGRFLFMITELTAEVVSYRWDARRGRLHHVQSLSTNSPDFKGTSSGAHIDISPAGRHVYTSNRGENTIVVHAVNQQNGTMKEVQRISSNGQNPRALGLHPGGRWLLVTNNVSNSIAVFAVEPATGMLSLKSSVTVPSPASVAFIPVGN